MKPRAHFHLPGRRILLALFFAFGPALTHAAPQKNEGVHLNGQTYVSLAGWARANDLKWSWLNDDKTVVATNRTTRLVFEVNSAQAQINGVRVRLSFPFAVEKEVPLIARLDLDTAIDPLIFSPHLADARPVKTICLDPGHGGKDTGNRANGHYEKNYTLPLAFELRDQLQQAGFKVIMTRTTDRYVELPDRPALANRRGANLFVSLHFNAAVTGLDEVEGPETYCLTPVGAGSSNAQGEGADHARTPANAVENESLLLAYHVQKSLVQTLPANDRGVKRARFAVFRDTTMPAILIEGGFMTHPVESKKIYDKAYRHRMAEAIVKGILAYQQLASRQ